MATPLQRAHACLAEASHLLLAPDPDRLDRCAALFSDAAEYLRQLGTEDRTSPDVHAFLAVWRDTNEAFDRAGEAVVRRLRSAAGGRYGAAGQPALRLAVAGQEIARY